MIKSTMQTDFSSISDELREAYRLTHFKVLKPVPYILKIGKPSSELACLYRELNVSTAAFLTAWNPRSKPTGKRENECAQGQLEQRLSVVRVSTFSGIALDPTGQWPDEPSVLVLGIDQDTAAGLGNEFKQNAIVWIGSSRIPELIFLR